MIRDRGTRGVGGLKNIEINGVRGLGRRELREKGGYRGRERVRVGRVDVHVRGERDYKRHKGRGIRIIRDVLISTCFIGFCS